MRSGSNHRDFPVSDLITVTNRTVTQQSFPNRSVMQLRRHSRSSIRHSSRHQHRAGVTLPPLGRDKKSFASR